MIVGIQVESFRAHYSRIYTRILTIPIGNFFIIIIYYCGSVIYLYMQGVFKKCP